jgi:hypothetical protein
MDQLAVQPTAPAHQSAQGNTSTESVGSYAACSRRKGCLRSFGPELPGFRINFEAATSIHAAGLTDEYIQKLLNDYQQEAATAISEDAGSLAEESYETTGAMTQFAEDLSEAPYQCSRCVKQHPAAQSFNA